MSGVQQKKVRLQVDADKDDEEVRQSSAAQGYSWEKTKVRSWDQIEEDPVTGQLKSYNKEEQIARKRRRDDGLRGVRRGIIRFCVLVIDMSESMRLNDLKPTRAGLVATACTNFIREFFDQNPISQLAVVVSRDDVATRMSPLSSNPNTHIEAVQQALRLGPLGSVSLQNAVDLTRTMLSPVPAYGMREMVLIYGALSSCDPGDIFASIDELAKERVRCSAVGLTAELHILRVLTQRTNGTYSVALTEAHFDDLMSGHVSPPPTTVKQTSASLIRMGFPILKHCATARPFVNNPVVSGKTGYECPRCSAWISDVPSECTLCGLILVSSPHLARSYHHLFPVPKYVSSEDASDELTERALNILKSETDDAGYDADGDQLMSTSQLNVKKCYGCLKPLDADTGLLLICPSCARVFCIECDVFVHDSLHHCPGCGCNNSIEAA